MTRLIRIALIVLCVTGCLGAAFAVSSAAADLSPTTETHTTCPQHCLTDGNTCAFASDCTQYPGVNVRCCSGFCAFCPS